MVQAADNQPLPLLSGEVVRRFQSEFHTTLSEIKAEDYSWIKWGSYRLNDQAEKLAANVHRDLRPLLDEVAPDAEHYLKEKILSNLSKDLVAVSGSKVSASINAIYVPLLHRKAQIPEAQGFYSLQIAIPNFAQLGWDVISDLRNHESLIQFRQRMLAIESIVSDALSVGEYDEAQYQISLSQAFISELLREIADLRPKVGEVVGNAIFDLLFGSIPIPGVGTAINSIRGAAKLEEANKSWIAAFLRLRRPEE